MRLDKIKPGKYWKNIFRCWVGFRYQICLLLCKFKMLTTPKTTSQNREHYIVEVVVSERKDEQPHACHYGRNSTFWPKSIWNFWSLVKIQIKKKRNFYPNINFCRYLSHSAHWAPNFTNPEFQFPHFKVLQSVCSFFNITSYIGIFECILISI